MSRTFRRFEILLPLRFNDGQAVPDELIAETLLELREHFGAVSAETKTIRGLWQHEGKIFRDDLVRILCLTRRKVWNSFKRSRRERSCDSSN